MTIYEWSGVIAATCAGRAVGSTPARLKEARLPRIPPDRKRPTIISGRRRGCRREADDCRGMIPMFSFGIILTGYGSSDSLHYVLVSKGEFLMGITGVPSVRRGSGLLLVCFMLCASGGCSDSGGSGGGGGGPTSSITVTSPNGGENWIAGTSATVSWTTTGSVGNVNIELSADNGASWIALTSDTANDGNAIVTVPDTPSATCLVRVQDVAGSPSDTSDSVFTIEVTLAISTSSPMPAATVGASYTQVLTAVNGTPSYSWSTDSGTLPAGINLSSTGVMSGTPNVPGTYSFVVRVIDGTSATATQGLTITVNPQLQITTSSLPSWTSGIPYSQSLTSTGGT